jgi:hypothetical protein
MVFPRIVTDPTTSSNKLYFMPQDVAAALGRLYLKLYWGEITQSEYDEKAQIIVDGARTRIGVIRNIGG